MNPLPWKGIVIHHSLTKDGATVSWDAIRRFHTDPAGPYKMREIGYHAGVELAGSSYEVLLGRPLDWAGGHAKGRNQTHLGFLFVGNYDDGPPPESMLRTACERILRPWMKAFGIAQHMIEPHRMSAPYKSCPGDKFDMEDLLDVLGGLPPADF